MKSLSAFAACAFALALHGTEYYIAADGDDANDGKSRDKAFASPTMINSKSASGNVFHIYPGTYVLTGAVKPAKTDMTIIGEGERPEDVVLDANGIDRGIQCGQANLVVANLKVIGGAVGDRGGGAYITGTGSVVSNCVFEANTCTNSGSNLVGGGLYAKNTEVVDCSFSFNIAGKGGGGLGLEGTASARRCTMVSNSIAEVVAGNYQCGGGGACLSTAGAVMEDCAFVGNQCRYGGAMHGNPGRVVNCAFTNNTALHGGVIQMNGNKTTITTQLWENCIFVNNFATNNGGVFRPRGAGDILRIDGCVFEGNDSQSGAVIFARDQSAGDMGSRVLSASNCVFRANGATTTFNIPFWSQGVSPDEFVGCGFFDNVVNPARAYLVYLNSNTKIERCSFMRNKLGFLNNYGGCIVVNGTNVVVRSCLFATNEVNQGRGICVDVAGSNNAVNEDNWAVVENCTIACNVQKAKNFGGNYGGIIYATSNTVIRNSLFYRNNCGLGKHVFQNFGGTATQAKNVFNCWEAPIASGQLADGVNGTRVDGETDLRLADPARFSFSLRSRSPLRDKGVAVEWMADAFDLAGAPRLGGSAPDIGAYEYIAPRGFSIKIR